VFDISGRVMLHLQLVAALLVSVGVHIHMTVDLLDAKGAYVMKMVPITQRYESSIKRYVVTKVE